MLNLRLRLFASMVASFWFCPPAAAAGEVVVDGWVAWAVAAAGQLPDQQRHGHAVHPLYRLTAGDGPREPAAGPDRSPSTAT